MTFTFFHTKQSHVQSLHLLVCSSFRFCRQWSTNHVLDICQLVSSLSVYGSKERSQVKKKLLQLLYFHPAKVPFIPQSHFFLVFLGLPKKQPICFVWRLIVTFDLYQFRSSQVISSIDCGHTHNEKHGQSSTHYYFGYSHN